MKRNSFQLIFLFLFLVASNAFAQITITFTTSDYNGSNVSCFGAQDGSVSVHVSGGTPPYTYLWSNDATTATISNLATGYYSVSVMDSDSVKVSDGLNISGPKQLDLSLNPYKYNNGFNVSCFQCFNGSVTLTLLGGTPTYTYLWSDGATTANRTSMGAGAYDLTVTDVNGCRIRTQLFLKQPDGGWTINGNTGNSNTSFIGTSDVQDLVIKTSGTERMKIGSSGGIGINGDLRMNSLSGGASFNAVFLDENGTLKIQPGPGQGGSTLSPCQIPFLGAWFQETAISDDIYRCVGNVGIGLTASSYLNRRLVVNGDVRFVSEKGGNGFEILGGGAT